MKGENMVDTLLLSTFSMMSSFVLLKKQYTQNKNVISLSSSLTLMQFQSKYFSSVKHEKAENSKAGFPYYKIGLVMFNAKF